MCFVGKQLASTSFCRQVLSTLLVQRWRGSSGNVRLSNLLISYCFHSTEFCNVAVFTIVTGALRMLDDEDIDKTRLRNSTLNPLDSKCNYSVTSNNTKLLHWPLMGGLLHLVQPIHQWPVYQSLYCYMIWGLRFGLVVTRWLRST